MEYKLPEIKANPWSLALYKYKPEKELVDLIEKILIYDGKKRLKPFEALTHPYFSDLPEYKEYTKKLPYLFYFKDL